METSPKTLPGRSRRTSCLILAVMLVIVIVIASYALPTLALTPPGGAPGHKLNILVLGLDERKGDRGRTDTMVVVSIDYLTKEVRLLSFPRDTRVQLPGKGFDKANSAYAAGGPRASMDVVSRILEIPIHNFVTTNFAGVTRIVDRLGGVVINVDKPMKYDDPYQNLHINIRAGQQLMDGKTVLEYARYRSDPEGDIARTRRQQTLIVSILKKAALPSSWRLLPALLSDVKEMLKTDIGAGRLPFVGLALVWGASRGVRSQTLPGKAVMLGGVSYWSTEPRQVNDLVRDFLGIPLR